MMTRLPLMIDSILRDCLICELIHENMDTLMLVICQDVSPISKAAREAKRSRTLGYQPLSMNG